MDMMEQVEFVLNSALRDCMHAVHFVLIPRLNVFKVLKM